MEKSQTNAKKDGTAKTERSDPLPLPDHRRLMRPVSKPVKPGQVFTDWASI